MTVYIIILAVAVFAIAMLGLAVGTIVAGRRLRGSCGGLAGLRDEQGNPFCEACSNPATDCADFQEKERQEQLAHSTSGEPAE